MNSKRSSERTHIAYIPQESPVFDGTLRENLVFDSVADDRQILEVLEKVCLAELYAKLEKGLDTELGEKGFMLSGGERQRLSLARLWFSSSSIVILDEATSAMDNLTEERVMAQVMERLTGKTVLVIAHRLSTIKNFGRIIAFRNGEIAARAILTGCWKPARISRSCTTPAKKNLGPEGDAPGRDLYV